MNKIRVNTEYIGLYVEFHDVITNLHEIIAKDIDETIGARSQKIYHGLKYKNPLKNNVHEMPTGDQLPPH